MRGLAIIVPIPCVSLLQFHDRRATAIGNQRGVDAHEAARERWWARRRSRRVRTGGAETCRAAGDRDGIPLSARTPMDRTGATASRS
jgi:hypothetical protein